MSAKPRVTPLKGLFFSEKTGMHDEISLDTRNCHLSGIKTPILTKLLPRQVMVACLGETLVSTQRAKTICSLIATTRLRCTQGMEKAATLKMVQRQKVGTSPEKETILDRDLVLLALGV